MPRSFVSVCRGVVAAAIACTCACSPASRTKLPVVTSTGSARVEPGEVAEVEIVGVDDVASLRRVVGARVGSTFSPAALASDIHALWNTGLVDDVVASTQTLPTGAIRLVYSVTPRPIIRSWTVRGSPIDTSPQSPPPSVGQRLSRKALSIYARELRDVLESEGYFRSATTVSFEDAGNHQIDVTLNVAPGPIAKLSNVVFSGNKAATAGELRELLGMNDGIYRRRELEEGLLRVSALYFDRGYVVHQLGSPEATWNDELGTLALDISIHEGARFRIGEITVTGELDGEAKDYRALVKVRRGQVFNRTNIGLDIERLTQAHRARAHPRAITIPNTAVNQDTNTVDIEFEIRDE